MTYQGAIDELKSLENNESMPDWFKPTLKKVRETMEMDGRENVEGEWISVSERLPDNNVRVLCSAISTSISGGYTRFVGCCNNGFWFVQTDAETVSYPRQYKVTAWMPLPESYEAEEVSE